MEEKRKPFLRRLEDFLAGKGFYIVLSVCIVIIGVSAWILLSSDDTGNQTDVDNNLLAADSADPNSNTATVPQSTKPAVPNTNTGDDNDSGQQGETGNDGQTQEPGDSVETMAPATDDEQYTETDYTEPSGDDESAPPAFAWPVSGDVAVGYSSDALIYNKTMMDWRTHNGIDIAANIGTKVFAAADGTVESIYTDDMFGTTVVIEHSGGYKTTYSNMAATPVVAEGDSVTMGAVIGSVGDTALAEKGEVAHLHFAIATDGESADPTEYLPKQ